MNIFCSYSHKDKKIVYEIAQELGAAGFSVWVDTNLVGGSNWAQEIEITIRQADFVLVFISKNSVESEWIMNEITYAGQLHKTIIPILIEDAEIPISLIKKQYIDFRKPSKRGINELIEILRTKEGPKPKDIIPTHELAKAVAEEVGKILGIEKKSLGTEEAIVVDPKLVFVIMSFDNDMDPVFDGIAEAAKSVGLSAKRVKDIIGDYRITDKIIDMIRVARLIVVDLTHERPNVYFELGYARGLNKTVITTVKEGTNVHFDVKDWTFISYNDSRTLEKNLKTRFEYELARKE